MSKPLNPTSTEFAPGDTQKNGTIDQATGHCASYLEARVTNLEEKNVTLQEEFSAFRELVHGIASAADKLVKSGWPGHTGLPQGMGSIEASLRSAREFSMDFEKLKVGTGGAVNRDSGNTAKEPTADLRDKELESRNANDLQKHPMQPLKVTTPYSPLPHVPTLTADELPLVENVSLNDKQPWKPYHLTTLSPFLDPIPDDSVTFHPDFLANHLGGIPWSPGLRFIKAKGPCILKNRTYYQIDPKNEPYLPQTPGQHGAKLTAFFNKAPEEEYGYLFARDASSYMDVPLFILVGERYLYYGNYSQTRWSDKLDHDTMTTRVPDHVKNFWAEELTSPVREKWVTEELKKHFFRKPEYEGRIAADAENEASADSVEEAKITAKMMKDVRKYVDELRQWDREASMKTAMMKKRFILDAFNASDMDETPALRLWWEYLECVGWRKDFYDLLVALQEREGKQYA